MKKILCSLTSALLLATLFMLLAPSFLTYSDMTRKADAVVLYLGPERESRLNEARQLIREGQARYLIIPTHGEVHQVQNDGTLKRISRDFRTRGNLLLLRKAANYRDYYENTHVESCEAKRVMDDLGLRSALLVSSPYHMRRIKMIAGRVFRDDAYTTICNPAREEAPFTSSDWFDKGRGKTMVSEYVKIAWFLIYAPFRSV